MPELKPPASSPDKDGRARELVNQAQFDMAEVEGEGFGDDFATYPQGEGEEEEFEDPVQIVRGFHRSMEFTDLIGVCQEFVAGASRLVPRLRGQECTESQVALVLRHLEKIGATSTLVGCTEVGQADAGAGVHCGVACGCGPGQQQSCDLVREGQREANGR
ncbi:MULTISPECIES: DUF6192 family protein [unclassified Streptomyces]|uniref:DUF6192 family protein n=1 Tax=unclassified Streptomyces TaxID=2593676 RepID=UPI00382809C3